MSKRQRRLAAKRRRHGHSRPAGRQLAAGAGLTIGATLAAGGTAQAANFTVTSTADTGGTCPTPSTCASLRQAINSANANGVGDSITFTSTLSGSIDLGGDLPTITGPTYIYGPGASQLAVDGGDGTSSANSIFSFDSPSVPFGSAVSGLTLRDGFTPFGGAALSNADFGVFVYDSVITGNHATGSGGGVYNDAGMYLVNVTLDHNYSDDGSGGGIANDDGFMYTIYSAITGNGADSSGGGIENSDGTVLIFASSITHNEAGSSGGGINNHGLDADDGMYLGYSLVAHNNADGFGGGVETSAGDSSGPTPAAFGVFNSTFSNNTATSSGGAVDASYHYGPVSFYDTTIANNAAALFSGGIDNRVPSPYGTRTLYNTIVANNSAGTGPDLSGAFDASFTLVTNTSNATLTGGANVLGADPQLGPLASNGGPTHTRALPATSPAVDQGASYSYYDQRLLARHRDLPTIANAAGGDGSDIGAFELQEGPAVSAPPTASSKSNQFSFGKMKLNKDKGTATLTVDLPGPGTLALGGKGIVKQRPARAVRLSKKIGFAGGGRLSKKIGFAGGARLSKVIGFAGKVKLLIKAKSKAKAKLNETGRAKVRAKVTFTPTGGTPATQTKKIKLKKEL